MPLNPIPMCHRTSNIKDNNIHLLRDYSSVPMLSRNCFPGGDLAIWSDMKFGSAFLSY